jgi:hypothetical protein
LKRKGREGGAKDAKETRREGIVERIAKRVFASQLDLPMNSFASLASFAVQDFLVSLRPKTLCNISLPVAALF